MVGGKLRDMLEYGKGITVGVSLRYGKCMETAGRI